MRIPAAALTVACLLTSALFAQSEHASQVFHFNSSDTPQDMQAIVNAVRSVLQIPQTSYDMGSRTMTIQTTAANIALAEWLFQALEKPALQPTQSLQVEQNPGPAGPADRLFVFHLAHTDSVQIDNPLQGYQEMVNATRVLPELTKVFPRTGNFSMAVRGNEDQLALAGWLLQQLDQPVTAPGQPRAEEKFHSALAQMPEARLLYFAHTSTVQEFQPIVNALRVIPQLTRVFPVVSKGAVALDGPADRVALAEWLFGQMDLAAPEGAFQASAVYELTPGLDTAQVFFLPGSVTEQSFEEIVGNVRASSPRLLTFPGALTRTLAVRGTPAQVAQAAQIVKAAAAP